MLFVLVFIVFLKKGDLEALGTQHEIIKWIWDTYKNLTEF